MALYPVRSCLLLVCATLSIDLASAGRRIFDGVDTGATEYIWTAWVERNGSYVCGASILDDRWVITSGDCVRSFIDNSEPGSFNVHVGDYDTTVVDPDQQVSRSCNVLYNKNFNATTNQNNMGMMELETPLNFSAEVNATAYADAKIDIRILKASDCFLSGYGINENGTLNTKRQVIPVRVRNADRCVGLSGFDIEHHVCYSTTAGGPCTLDTGSPIVCNISGIVTQIAAQLDEVCTTGFHFGEYTYKSRRFISEALQNPTNQTCTSLSVGHSTVGCGPEGKAFMMTFPSPDPKGSRPTLYITCENDTSVTIFPGAEIAKYIMRTTYFCTSSNGLLIPLPQQIYEDPKTTSTKSIRIVADEAIFVMAGYEPDAIATTQIFPEECLKQLNYSYMVVSYAGGYNKLSELLVVAIENGTSVTMSSPINAQVTLNAFDVYRNPIDATGVTITASGPLSVFTGIECGNVDTSINYCDTMFEQMPPLNTTQTTYIVPPLTPRTSMILRIVPVEASTSVFIANNLGTNQTLNLATAGAFSDVPFSNLTYVSSTTPIILAAFGYGGAYDLLKIGDPSLLVVPAIEEYTTYYKIYAPATTGYNYATLIIKSADDASGLTINGAAITAVATETITVPVYGDFDVITVLLNYGVSEIEHTTKTVKFGVVQYNLQFYRETASAPRSLVPSP